MSTSPVSSSKKAPPKVPSSKKAPPKVPSSMEMVMEAIKDLADRKGSSVHAIKKYISANHDVDMVKKAHFINKAVKAAVQKGLLIQTKGKGATGTFKLDVKKSVPKAEKKPQPSSPTKTEKTKKKKPEDKKPTSSYAMVMAAITNLEEPKGSSLAATKKYISTNYNVDIVKKAPYICIAIKAAVKNGDLVQTKGKGATGTFKLPSKKPTADKKSSNKKKSEKPETPVKKIIKANKQVMKLVMTPKKVSTKAKTPRKVLMKPKNPAKKAPSK